MAGSGSSCREEFYAADDARHHALKQGCRLRDDSDAELALRLYQLDGPDFVRRMDGVFAVAVWDSGWDLLVLASDRFGLRPVHFVAYSGCFASAPEMKAILADPVFPRTLDHAALAEDVRFQQVLGDKTFFDGIRLLPPASVLRLRVASLAIELNTYWDWRTIRPIKANCSMVDIVEETDRLLRRSIEVRLRHTERPGAYLSGGLDSRALLAKDRRAGVAQGRVSGNWGDGRSAERRPCGEEAVTSGGLAPWRGKKFGD